MSIRYSVLPANLKKGDVVKDFNGQTVEEIMLDGPSPHWVKVNGPQSVWVYTISPSGGLNTWKVAAEDRVTILDW